MAGKCYGYVQSWDKFGATIGLNVASKREFQTISGGLVSLILQVFIGVYFITQLLKVWNYTDSNISSFLSFDSRLNNEKVFNLQEYHTGFYWGFANSNSLLVSVDPRIGEF